MMTDKEVEEIIARWAGPSFNVTFPDDAQTDIASLLADRKALQDRVTRLRETLHGTLEHLNGELHDGRADSCAACEACNKIRAALKETQHG